MAATDDLPLNINAMLADVAASDMPAELKALFSEPQALAFWTYCERLSQYRDEQRRLGRELSLIAAFEEFEDKHPETSRELARAMYEKLQ